MRFGPLRFGPMRFGPLRFGPKSHRRRSGSPAATRGDGRRRQPGPILIAGIAHIIHACEQLHRWLHLERRQTHGPIAPTSKRHWPARLTGRRDALAGETHWPATGWDREPKMASLRGASDGGPVPVTRRNFLHRSRIVIVRVDTIGRQRKSIMRTAPSHQIALTLLARDRALSLRGPQEARASGEAA